MKRSKFLRRPDAVNVAYMVKRCHVLGPGERFVLWVQGCPLRCPGCHNPQFQPFRDATWLSVESLGAMVLAVGGIEGVTYVGGEPFAQAQALAELSRRLRVEGLSVMVYSGFTYEQLRQGGISEASKLLAHADLLLDGPYLRELPSDKPWRGSDNQRLIALSERYRLQVPAWNRPTGQEFEIRFSGAGAIEVLGIPPRTLSETLRSGSRMRRKQRK